MSIFSKKKNMQTGTHTGLHIVLEHGGTPLYELQTGDYAKDIIIGRASDCTWSLDGVDLSASSKHAMISKRKSNFYITDLGSRNGIFYQNKRIKERKLAVGDRINLGECTISVETGTQKTMKISQFHRLFYTNEKGKHITANLSKPRMVLGSAGDCDLIFQDQLISSHHAELILKNDGSCWLRDLGSRNGTSVNGTELFPDSERMLQDNDTITIAYLDLKFWDASVEHQESRLWSSIIAVAITVIVVLGLYIGYSKISPGAESQLASAWELMQQDDLSTAKDILINSVPHADGGVEITIETRRQELLKRIELWEKTRKIWDSVKQDLNKGMYIPATQKISCLNMDDINAWNWKGGAAEKKKVAAAKKLLDACFSAKSCLKNPASTVDELEQKRKDLLSAVTECEKYKDDYFIAAVKCSTVPLKTIEKTLKDDQELKQTLSLLDSPRPDYAAIEKRLTAISKESYGATKTRAERILPSVITLKRETMRIAMMIDKICDLDFQSVQNFNLDLPDGIDYSSEKNIGSLKNQLINTVERFKDTALQLSLIYSGLIARGISPNQPVPYFPSFQNAEIMEKVYRIDTLDYPMPKRSRTEPSGEYDRLLGTEFFYDYVSNVSSHFMSLNMDDLTCKPEIYMLKQNLLEIEKFVSFADKDENQWFNNGKFAEYLKFCRGILNERDQFAAKQYKRPDKPGTREFLISRGMAAYLLPEGDLKSKLEKDIETSCSQLKRTILKLNKEYNIAMPVEALQLRMDIIRTGLPGDAVVKRMWNQRPENGWGK